MYAGGAAQNIGRRFCVYTISKREETPLKTGKNIQTQATPQANVCGTAKLCVILGNVPTPRSIVRATGAVLGLPRHSGTINLHSLASPSSKIRSTNLRTSSSVSFASLRLPCGTHHRWLTISEAERMKSKGDCKRLRIPSRRNPVYQLLAQAEPSKSELTPPSITVSDMKINAGFGSHEDIARVRAKVREFGKSRLVCA